MARRAQGRRASLSPEGDDGLLDRAGRGAEEGGEHGLGDGKGQVLDEDRLLGSGRIRGDQGHVVGW